MEDGKQTLSSGDDLGQAINEMAQSQGTEVVDSQFLADALLGLRSEQKFLHCKYLYDRRGSKLFDMICELDEYYPTRTEASITMENAADIGACIGDEAVLVEYGSGSSTKTRVLLEHLKAPRAYLPVDISEEHLLDTSEQLRSEYPGLRVQPIVADFTAEVDLPEEHAQHPVCVYFPGSTIGNLEVDDALLLLERIAWQSGEGGGLLIGFDLQKSVEVLERAYNDEAGITAEFNLNLLRRMNRELEADFDVEQFAHVAFYSQTHNRIEIYIESLCDQQVTIAGETIQFELGERILTEYSHKYSISGFAQLAEQAGFRQNKVWTDDANFFALMHLTVDAPCPQAIN